MSKFIGTVTDRSFVKAIADLDISLQEKADMLHSIREDISDFFINSKIKRYQSNRFYNDEVETCRK